MKIIMALAAAILLGGGNDQPTAELFAPGAISTSGFELGAAFGPDGKSFYFADIGGGFATSTIMVSYLDEAGWRTPEPVSFADARYRDLDVALSPDGNMMVLQSDRPVEGEERKDWDIWVSRLGQDGWGAPENAGPTVNDDGTQTFPVILGDGSLMFSTAAAGRDDLDVMIAQANGGGFGAAVPLGSPPNSSDDDSNAVISPNGRLMVIGSDALPGHLGGGDLYLLEKTDDGWSEPRHMDAINTEHREFAPAFSPANSPDGAWLYFTSNRPRPDDGKDNSDGGPGDIYRVPVNGLQP